MKFKLSEIGCDEEYGEETVLFEDEQIGEVTIREIELDSLADVFDLIDDDMEVRFTQSYWERYDGDVLIIAT